MGLVIVVLPRGVWVRGCLVAVWSWCWFGFDLAMFAIAVNVDCIELVYCCGNLVFCGDYLI